MPNPKKKQQQKNEILAHFVFDVSNTSEKKKNRNRAGKIIGANQKQM